MKSEPTSAPASQPALADEGMAFFFEGLDDALAGDVETGLEKLREAATESPDNSRFAVGLALVEDYSDRLARAEKERSEDYAKAVNRVKRYMLAQSYLKELRDKKIDTKLRSEIKNAVAQLNNISDKDDLATADDEEVAELARKSIEAVQKLASPLNNAQKLLKGDDSQYAGEFRRICGDVTGDFQEYQQVLKIIAANNIQSREGFLNRLSSVEERVAQNIADLEVMTAKKPWRMALAHTRLAKELALPKDKQTQQTWYLDLIADAQQRGKDSVANAKWYDALSAYSGLESLEPENESYETSLKTVRRHVRVLGLYGNGSFDDDTKTEKPEEDDLGWRDIVSGVDSDMVKRAISQLDASYVTAVDYKKVATGALNSVKVLAETPQVVDTFPGLKDEEKRGSFLKAVDRQLDYIEKKSRVDHMELALVLNAILSASENTVEIPTEVLTVEFTDGFLSELDEFSSMIWPNDVEDFRKMTMGKFSGVGIQITKEPGEYLKVVTPLADSPALKAGIKTDDIILSVDGTETKSLSVDKLVRMITGKRGTKVVLRIKRHGKLKPFDVPLIREDIRIRTVKGWRRNPSGDWDFILDKEAGIGYIRITQFTDRTPGDFNSALRNLNKAGVKSLILDLRLNPGGLLRPAAKVADEFLKSGRIVSTKGRQVRETSLSARWGGKFLDGELIVLVNEHSASAAEIVSGAIQDTARGAVAGMRSYGKGSVQNVIEIRRQRAYLKLTTAYYYLPSGRCLHRLNSSKDWGVDPDYKIPVTPRQLKRWLEIRRKTDLLQEIDPDELSNDLAKQFDADIQLNTAVTLLKLIKLQKGKLAA